MNQLQYEVNIKIYNAIHSGVPRNHAKYIAEAVAYEKTYWRQGPIKKEEVRYTAHFFMHKGRDTYLILTGHLKRILLWAKQNNVKITVSGNRPSSYVEPHRQSDFSLRSIIPRPDQVELVNAALTAKRGVIKAPTRSGKTVIQYSIVSAYDRINTLFLAHTKDLVNQLADEGDRFGFNVARYVGDRKELDWDDENQVVVMTRQSCANLIKNTDTDLSNYFQMMIIDEAHHVTTPEGQYAKILGYFDAPLRYGFTATMPSSVESQLSLEGFVGPLIGELTIDEAINKDILVKPKIVLKKAHKTKIPIQTKYADAYDRGVVDNLNRNRMIAETAKEYIDQGHSVLILVTKIRHGDNILNALREIFVRGYYVHGDTESELRSQVKEGLIKKEIMCVIATTVWKEGINIPTLNVCINAAGGKSEIATLQSVGRSLTKAEGKTNATIVDIFDPSHHYLISHFGERVILYTDQGWM